nr:uncharacterized protein LOC124815559 [Hydra vulgaris]
MEEKSSIKEGYLFVQTSTVFRHWGSYKAMYLILTNDYLYCFKRYGEITSVPKDIISLNDVSIMVEESRRGFIKRFLIKIKTNSVNKKCFTFISFEAEERNNWLTCILQVLAAKFTNNISENNTVLNSKKKRFSLLVNPEKEKLKSLSCLDLTNTGVIVSDPTMTYQSITPLRRAFCEKHSVSTFDISKQVSLSPTNLNRNRHSTCISTEKISFLNSIGLNAKRCSHLFDS